MLNNNGYYTRSRRTRRCVPSGAGSWKAPTPELCSHRHCFSMNWTSLALIAITLVGGLLRFYAIGSKGLWLDEAFSVWMGRQPLPDLIGWLVRIDQHPPLYSICNQKIASSAIFRLGRRKGEFSKAQSPYSPLFDNGQIVCYEDGKTD